LLPQKERHWPALITSLKRIHRAATELAPTWLKVSIGWVGNAGGGIWLVLPPAPFNQRLKRYNQKCPGRYYNL